MAYPYPTNVTNLLSFFEYGNQITYGWFATAIIFTIFCVAFLALKVYSTHRAFATASFLAMILSIIFFVLGLIQQIVLIISIALVVVGVVWLWFADKYEA